MWIGSRAHLLAECLAVAGAPYPHTDQNFPNFMQFFGKIWQICMLAPPPGGLTPPPARNPGSAPVWFVIFALSAHFCSCATCTCPLLNTSILSPICIYSCHCICSCPCAHLHPCAHSHLLAILHPLVWVMERIESYVCFSSECQLVPTFMPFCPLLPFWLLLPFIHFPPFILAPSYALGSVVVDHMILTSHGWQCNFLMEKLQENPRISQSSLYIVQKLKRSSDLPIT